MVHGSAMSLTYSLAGTVRARTRSVRRWQSYGLDGDDCGAAASSSELGGVDGVGGALRLRRGKARRGERGQSACGEQQGALLFKPASALRGQGEPSAWQTRGGRHLTSVGHERSKAETL